MQTLGSEPPSMQAIAAGVAMLLTELEAAVERRLTIAHAAKRTRSEYCEEAEGFRTWFEMVASRPVLGSDLTVGNADRYLVDAMTSATERGRPWA